MIDDDEIVALLEEQSDPPFLPTEEIASHFDVTSAGILKRLKPLMADDQSPVSGTKIGSAWLWWYANS
jgi:hypothetical protein